MSVPPSIPENIVRAAREMRGEKGIEWVRHLPKLITKCEELWSLKVGPPFVELSCNYAAPATRADGVAAVLKLSFPEDNEFKTEAEALKVFDGRGICRLLELDLKDGAMLLERLEPGLPLDTVRDDKEATSIAADVMRNMWRPAPPNHQFPSVFERTRGLAHLREHFGGETGPMPTALVEEAEALFAELIPSQEPPVLLHGDLHHGNILSAGRRPWLAIDPKGVVGEPAFDVGALLHNPVELLERPDPGKVLQRRMEILSGQLGFDRARVRGWGMAQAVLAAYWGWEDDGEVWHEALDFARLLSEIKQPPPPGSGPASGRSGTSG